MAGRERARETAWRLPPQAVPGIFSAGLDITEMFGRSEERLGEFWRAVQQLWILLYGSRLATVAAVNVSRPAGLRSPSCRKTALAALPPPPLPSPPPSGKGRPVGAAAPRTGRNSAPPPLRLGCPQCSAAAELSFPLEAFLLRGTRPLGGWKRGRGQGMVKQGPPSLPPRAACGPTQLCSSQGSSPAGGCLMALSCDYRIMADNPKYKIGLNETRLGIVAPFW